MYNYKVYPYIRLRIFTANHSATRSSMRSRSRKHDSQVHLEKAIDIFRHSSSAAFVWGRGTSVRAEPEIAGWFVKPS